MKVILLLSLLSTGCVYDPVSPVAPSPSYPTTIAHILLDVRGSDPYHPLANPHVLRISTVQADGLGVRGRDVEVSLDGPGSLDQTQGTTDSGGVLEIWFWQDGVVNILVTSQNQHRLVRVSTNNTLVELP